MATAHDVTAPSSMEQSPRWGVGRSQLVQRDNAQTVALRAPNPWQSSCAARRRLRVVSGRRQAVSGRPPIGERLAAAAWVEPIPDSLVLAETGDPAELAATRESIRHHERLRTLVPALVRYADGRH